MTDDNWQYSVERKSEGEVTFEVRIPENDVKSERKQALNELKQEVEIPGFRKGHVPESILEKQRPQQIQQALLRRLVPRVCRRVYEKHDIRPVEDPTIQDFDFNGGFTLKGTVVEQPRVDVSDHAYRGIELEVEDDSVSEEDVDERIEQLQSSEASLEPVPIVRSVEEGDYVEIDFEGYDRAGNLIDGASGQEKMLEVGSERFLPEIEEGIVGASKGDSRSIEVDFDEDFIDDTLAGSTVEFVVSVNEIMEEQKPDPDSSEFLDAMNVESLEELREKVRERLSEVDEQERQDKMAEQINEFLLDHYEFGIVDSLVDDEVDAIINDYRQQVEAQDRDFKTYLEQQNQDVEELRREVRPDARSRIQLTLIFQAIAEEEDIEVDEDELKDHLRDLADQTDVDFEELMESPEEQRRSLRYQLRDDKVLNHLIELANVKEVEPDELDSESESEHQSSGSDENETQSQSVELR